MPRVRSGRPWLRARLDAVEMPLKRIKKSKNARMWTLLFDRDMGRRPSRKCKLLYTLVRQCVQLLDSLIPFTVAGLFRLRRFPRRRHTQMVVHATQRLRSGEGKRRLIASSPAGYSCGVGEFAPLLSSPFFTHLLLRRHSVSAARPRRSARFRRDRCNQAASRARQWPWPNWPPALRGRQGGGDGSQRGWDGR